MPKKLLTIFLVIILTMSFASCGKDKHAKYLFDELGFSVDTLSSWECEIKYIYEDRGSFEDTYTKIKYNPDDPNELLRIINCFEGAQATEAPKDFIFSAEGMSDYVINFYVDGAEEPALSFYYYKDGNLLTRVIRSYDEKKQMDVIDYEFFVPYGDLLSFVTAYRELAVVPTSEAESLSLNQKQLIASVEDEELAERMTYYDDEYEVQEGAELGEIPFEIYDGQLPDDEGTGCKLYSTKDIPDLPEDKLVLMARIADEKGDPMKLLITFVEYNTNYTIVTVSYPDQALMEELGIEVDNAIMLERSYIDKDKDKYIVFLDDDGEVIYVIVPFMN